MPSTWKSNNVSHRRWNFFEMGPCLPHRPCSRTLKRRDAGKPEGAAPGCPNRHSRRAPPAHIRDQSRRRMFINGPNGVTGFKVASCIRRRRAELYVVGGNIPESLVSCFKGGAWSPAKHRQFVSRTPVLIIACFVSAGSIVADTDC